MGRGGQNVYTKKVRLEKAKVSLKPSGHPNSLMLAYGANTHNGIIRSYNEDRISIVLDLKRPTASKESWSLDTKIQFFAVFDGHGGQGCSEFLRDNLHNFVALSKNYPKDLELALRDGCE